MKKICSPYRYTLFSYLLVAISRYDSSSDIYIFETKIDLSFVLCCYTLRTTPKDYAGNYILLWHFYLSFYI